MVDFKFFINDPIHGSIGVTEKEKSIIDSAPFQRLRRIKQLGNVHLLFPTATHTRFAHSIGVMHVISELSESIFRSGLKRNPDESFAGAVEEIHSLLRIAGLLHDVGHGPLSHHFEKCLQIVVGGELKRLTFSDWKSDLKIPDAWIVENKLPDFKGGKLEHEHFSFGVIKKLGEVFDFDAQAVCSFLCEEIKPSADLVNTLSIVSSGYNEGGDAVFPEPLRRVLKSLLSGDIDADRLDYLKRDSFFCGTDIAAIDLNHLLSSIDLKFGNEDFYIQIRRNAVPIIENILFSRKQMFNQIYHHRLNGSFDQMLSTVLEKLLKLKSGIGVPTSLNDFLLLTDETVESAVRNLIADRNVDIETPGRIIDMCAKFYSTRTPLVQIYDETVKEKLSQDKVQTLKAEYPNDNIIHTINLKKFYKRDAGQDSVNTIRVKGRRSEAPDEPLAKHSQVLGSNLWKDDLVRIVVFKGYAESARLRNLESKLEIFPIQRTREEADRGASVAPSEA